jgi:hypothetical protein
MLVYVPFALCFVTLCGVFMHFPELTRCHSASSLFSAIFVFQKSCTGNILGIEQNKSQSSYFFLIRDGVQSRDGGGPACRRTIGWRGLPLARATRWCGHLAHLLTPPFCLYILIIRFPTKMSKLKIIFISYRVAEFDTLNNSSLR